MEFQNLMEAVESLYPNEWENGESQEEYQGVIDALIAGGCRPANYWTRDGGRIPSVSFPLDPPHTVRVPGMGTLVWSRDRPGPVCPYTGK